VQQDRQPFLFQQLIARLPRTGIGWIVVIGESVRPFLARFVDQTAAGNRIEPGPKIAALESLGEVMPDAFPNGLVQVFQVGAARTAGEKGEQVPRMSLVQLSARILG
jgi:hypothetical protein